ncbi:MAG: cation transporter [Bacteroidetes bacterium]|nr:cation transporter [Bacteroidota bacterium]
MENKNTSHIHHHHGSSQKNIALAFFLNLFFAIFELIGGLFTNSISILSDSLHDFGDSISLALAWYLEKISKKNTSATFSYGYKRFSLLGAVINSLILLVGAIFIIFESIERLKSPQPVEAYGMMWLAIFGVIVNSVVFLRSRGSKSLNERVVALHFLEDVLGWVAVLIGSILMIFFDIPKLDSILSIAISLFILFNVFRNLNESVKIILQKVPKNIDLIDLKKQIASIEDVYQVGDIHVWSLEGEYNIGTISIMLNEKVIMLSASQDISKKIRNILKSNSIEHTTIEIEPFNEEKALLKCPIDMLEK